MIQEIIEEWKRIEYYDYWISNLGRVKSKSKILKQCKSTAGYYVINLLYKGNQRTVNVHRLIAEAFIENPDGLPEVDHKDRNRSNNSIDNLRWATSLKNKINTGIFSTNTSGIKGVCWHKQAKKWRAFININNKQKGLGCYVSILDAIKARKEAEEKYWNNFHAT